MRIMRSDKMKKFNYKTLLNKEYRVLNVPNFDEINYQVFVKELRNKLNMSQTSFAKALGITPSTVEKWEMGVNKVNNASKRLLYLLDDSPELIEKLYSVNIVKTETVLYKEVQNGFFAYESSQKNKIITKPILTQSNKNWKINSDLYSLGA